MRRIWCGLLVLSWLTSAKENVYDHPDMHRQMIADTLRTEAYREALEREPSVVKGKVVMDFGCGTGILSMFAARAGARKVICVEMTAMAAVTKETVKRNGFEKVISVVKATDKKIPAKLEGKIDVLMSEWMGYLLLLEDMLAPLLDVRDKFLKPGGVVWPRYASMWIQPYMDDAWWANNMNYWDSKPYGVDMSAVGEYAVKEGYVALPRAGNWRASGLKGEPYRFFEWDLQSYKIEKNHRVEGQFSIPASPRVHGLLIWFDTIFDHPEGNVTLSTHPAAGVQHWRQIFWPMDQEVVGDVTFEGRVLLERNEPTWGMRLQWRAPPVVMSVATKLTGWLRDSDFGVADSWLATEAAASYIKEAPDEGSCENK
jgi:SAM-dependent methyltransferase